MKKPSISFFCPAYFDEKNLPILIPKIFKVLKENTSAFDILIVEDGSPDKTKEVADRLSAKYQPFVKVIHHEKNMGYGATLRDGFRNAKKYDYTFYTDGDIQYDVAEIEKMLPYLKNYDAVIGFRKKRALTFSRQLQTLLFNWLIRFLFSTDIKDINCSMKIVSRKALDSIKLTSNSSFIDAELLIKLRDKGYKIKEIPVSHFPRKFGKASGGSRSVIFRTIEEMMKFYFKK
ncbi:MAG: glycosyltransferase family 2 protein [Candidatus Levybacteria bacterium]|nr:glycosyltransferase family 2 protein [Candidatus Levybacteria bacterium]